MCVPQTEAVDTQCTHLRVQMLLEAPLAAAAEVQPDFDKAQYMRRFTQLAAQEQDYFQRAGACGHCGARADDSDAAWLDFRSYVQFKALAQQVPIAAWCAASHPKATLHSELHQMCSVSMRPV